MDVSTSETSTAATGLPTLVFTTGRPERSSFSSGRLWIDLDQPPAVHDDLLVEARDRVDKCLPGWAVRQSSSAPPSAPRPQPTPPVVPPPEAPRREPVRDAVPAPSVRLAYAVRLSILVLWSVLFIVGLALVGKVGR